MLVKGATGVVRQQVITWASVDLDLCHHIASLGHSDSMIELCMSCSEPLYQADFYNMPDIVHVYQMLLKHKFAKYYSRTYICLPAWSAN